MNKLRKLINIVAADAIKQARESSEYMPDETISNETELVEYGQYEFFREQKRMAIEEINRRMFGRNKKTA